MARFLIAFLLLCVSASAQTYSELRAHIIIEEGYSPIPYLLRGVPHIGLGHRIYGAGPKRLTNAQIEVLFAADLKTACEIAYRETEHFSRHPKPVRVLLCALAYNLGESGYHEFYRFRAAIDRGDYPAAARELQASKWSTQLPNRAARYIATLNSI